MKHPSFSILLLGLMATQHHVGYMSPLRHKLYNEMKRKITSINEQVYSQILKRHIKSKSLIQAGLPQEQQNVVI